MTRWDQLIRTPDDDVRTGLRSGPGTSGSTGLEAGSPESVFEKIKSRV